MAQRFIQIAVLYLVFGALLGLVMGISGNFTLAPVHAHLVLVGWLSLALVGVVYHPCPAAARTGLAKAHFWLHNIGLPIFMVGLSFALSGTPGLTPIAGTGASLLLLGLVLFAANVLRNVRAG
jgi:cbb3-type cytochrome oxidase subunit 1